MYRIFNSMMQTKIIQDETSNSKFKIQSGIKGKNDLDDLFSAMRDAVSGFEELKTTYEDDVQTVAQLDVL